jgi:glycine C-acetyltransferase
MRQHFYSHLSQELSAIESAKLTKHERLIDSQQAAQITLRSGDHVLNFCANNYLGLANSPALIQAGKDALENYGYGVSSVRFICGTQTVHRELEVKIADFLEKEDCILYGSCFDANGGLFETLLSDQDAIISDALNHASIIDGIRLCKAKRFRYKNNDMQDLETQLQEAETAGARFKMIATDGVFSMDGIIANLPAICDLADKYNAIVMVDDSHATGFIGKNGKGTGEYHGVQDRIDIFTGTLGKALGGASGGYIVGKQPVIDLLKQRSRPYLFSNALAPMIAGGSIKALELIQNGHDLREKLEKNKKQFRTGMEKAGFTLIPGDHPIIPVMFFEEAIAVAMASQLLEEGIYVIPFSYPVVPKGLARIRTQISAGHTSEQIDKAIAAFTKVGKGLGIIS